MKEFRVDLHLHTCLSPCGSLEMSPRQIVETALEQGLDAIAVTDHNSTLQCPEIQALGEEYGLVVFAGAEVTTREEAHCVALFSDDQARAAFQKYLEEHLPEIRLIEPEGTYLLWLDFKALHLNEKELEHLIVDKAHLWLDSGAMFGPDGEGFERINIACPRATVEKALKQLEAAIRG